MSQDGSTFSRVCEWAAFTYSVQLQTNVSIPEPVWVRSHDTLHLSGTSCHTSRFSHSDQGENCNSWQKFKQINPDRIFGEWVCSMFTLAIFNIFCIKYSAFYVRCYMNYHFRWSVLFKDRSPKHKHKIQYPIYNIQKQHRMLSTKIKAFFYIYKMHWTLCFGYIEQRRQYFKQWSFTSILWPFGYFTFMLYMRWKMDRKAFAWLSKHIYSLSGW